MSVAVVREAVASARTQPVASTVTILMIVGMILAVMLTTGRTVGAEQAVLGSIDSAGTRSIVFRADAGAGVTSEALERARGISGIEWMGAFGAAVDGTNAAFSDGTRVPVRTGYGDDLTSLGIAGPSAAPGTLAWASSDALTQLGMVDAAGGITLTSRETVGVGGRLFVPDFLHDLEPLVVVPQQDGVVGAVSVVVVIAERPDLVTPVSQAVLSVMGAADASKITVETSEELATLRALVQGQLGSFSRGLVVAILALMGVLVAMLLYGLVMMRRRDFGRRRALGASRGLVIALVLMQTLALAAVGVVIGVIASLGILLVSGDPLPGLSFTAALSFLVLFTSAVSALVPAVIASRREPIRELRVP
ncbi:FtsX-like permease family protein [Microbacterium phyllosphaerae]|uniref:FtsX-like permease family protein n=1 Tax=Microbacterium phyllosphaerae TaxID=124798 RepID=UPI000EA05EA1|nr:FtsX-like permease family protein [Microbacterium phyllosphaerae]